MPRRGTTCYWCGRPASGTCPRCGRSFCATHGLGICIDCYDRARPGMYLKGTLLLVLTGSCLAAGAFLGLASSGGAIQVPVLVVGFGLLAGYGAFVWLSHAGMPFPPGGKEEP